MIKTDDTELRRSPTADPTATARDDPAEAWAIDDVSFPKRGRVRSFPPRRLRLAE